MRFLLISWSSKNRNYIFQSLNHVGINLKLHFFNQPSPSTALQTNLDLNFPIFCFLNSVIFIFRKIYVLHLKKSFSGIQGIPAFRDFTICDACYIVILFWASFHDFEEKNNKKKKLNFFLQNHEMRPTIESRNSGYHELWNHQMRGSPVVCLLNGHKPKDPALKNSYLVYYRVSHIER